LKNKYRWKCDDCGATGFYEELEFDTIVVRCSVCRGLNISSEKIN